MMRKKKGKTKNKETNENIERGKHILEQHRTNLEEFERLRKDETKGSAGSEHNRGENKLKGR